MSIDPTIYLQADTIIQMPPAPPNPIRFAEIWLLLIYCERKILFVR
jgi:hypothetical protein